MCTFSNLLSPALKVANKLMEKSVTLTDTLITNQLFNMWKSHCEEYAISS